MALRLPADGLNVPWPVHRPPPAPVTDPASCTAGSLAQEVSGAPASTTGAGVIMSVMASLTALQVPLPTVVRVRVTDPAAISAAVGT